MDNEAPATPDAAVALKNNQSKSKPGPGKGGKRPGAGRKKGVPNKLTADLKAVILAAFDGVGGKDYLRTLAKTDPRTFCTLLAKILPTQVAGWSPARKPISSGSSAMSIAATARACGAGIAAPATPRTARPSSRGQYTP